MKSFFSSRHKNSLKPVQSPAPSQQIREISISDLKSFISLPASTHNEQGTGPEFSKGSLLWLRRAGLQVWFFYNENCCDQDLTLVPQPRKHILKAASATQQILDFQTSQETAAGSGPQNTNLPTRGCFKSHCLLEKHALCGPVNLIIWNT